MTGKQDIRGLLEYATVDEPPPTAGPAGVFSRARSIQRRRKLGVGLAGVATLGVLVVAGVSLAPTGTSGRDDGVAPAAVPGSTPSTGASHSPAPMAAGTVLETLRMLLPPGTRTSGEVARKGFAKLVVTDPGGRTTVEVNVQPDFATDAGKASTSELFDRYDCAKRTDPGSTKCTATVLNDGTRVVAVDGPSGEPGSTSTVRQVDILGRAGQRVVVTAWNAVDLKNGPTTRSAPALGTDQLQEIATSGRWSPAAAGPADGATSPDGGAPNK